MIFRKITTKILSLDYGIRKLFLIFIDFFCISFSILFSLVLNKELIEINNNFIYLLISNLCGLSIYYFTGQYKGLSRYLGSSELYKIIGRITILILVSVFILKLFSKPIPSFNFLILFWMILSFLSGATRFILRDILLFINKRQQTKRNVFIYGAGAAGVQLATSILYDGNNNILGFIDDNKGLWGRTLKGFKIFPHPFFKIKIENLIKYFLRFLQSQD